MTAPTWTTTDLPDQLGVQVESVLASLRRHSRVGVAFSGGVDSSVLLALTAIAVGRDRTVALLAVSPSLAGVERSAAHEIAAGLGVEVAEILTREGSRPEYVRNDVDRCFHCKDELFTAVSDQLLARHRLDAVAYGENADDVRRRDRPGSRAAAAHGVLSPLADAGLGKSEVRAVARSLGLPNADKPAAPCLASRIPHHTPVTPERLAQVERAERAVRSLGFSDCRVRHHGQVARIELPTAELARAVELADELRGSVRATGFRFVTLDLAGIQSGALTMDLLAPEDGR